MDDAPFLHGIARLRRAPDLAVGVAVAEADDADVRGPSDLPRHRLEMHVFPCARSAWGFAEGVLAAGGNALGAAAFGQIVLVARFPEDRPDAAALDGAVALVEHGASAASLAARAAEAEGRRLAREAEARAARAVESLWEPVRRALSGFPPKAPGRRGCFPWSVAAFQAQRPLTERKAFVEGTFDPDPPVNGAGYVDMFTAVLLREDDGGVTVTVDHVLGATAETVRHRLGAMEAACREVGFVFDTDTLRPRRRCRTPDLRASLAALPGLWRRLRRLAEECSAVEHAVRLSGDREIRRTLDEMVAGRAILQATTGSPGRLETARGGRDVPLRLIGTLKREGLVEIAGSRDVPERHGGVARLDVRWRVTELGRAVHAGDVERAAALASARPR